MKEYISLLLPKNWQQQLSIFSIASLILIILTWITYPNITHSKFYYIFSAILILLMYYEFGFLQFLALKNNDFWQKNEHQWIWPLVLFCSSILLNWGVLWDVWQSNYGNAYMLGGLLPNGDARQYFRGAETLIELGESTGRSLWRPLVTCFYATLLKISGQNIQLFLIMLTTIVSISIYVAAKSIYRVFGITAGYLTLLLLSSYYLFWNGTTMTEPVGFLFGNFSFALLCAGFYEKKRFLIYTGIFFLGVGLSARSGAMFVFPFLILGIGWLFKQNKSYDFKTMGISLLLALLAFMMSMPLVKTIGATTNDKVGASYQGSYSYTFYGLVHGGKSWRYVYKKFPELKKSKGGLSQSEKSSFIYREAFKKLKAEPQLFAKSILTSYSHVLRHPFKYFTRHIRFCIFIFLIPFTFIFVAPFFLKKQNDKQVLYMILLGALGVLISVPFIVPNGSNVFLASIKQMKYGTTVIFNVTLVSVGLGLLIRFIKNNFLTTKDTKQLLTNDAKQLPKISYLNKSFDIFWPTTLLILTLLGMTYFKLTAVGKLSFKDGLHQSCNRSISIVKLQKGSFINLVDNKQKTLVPDVRIEDFEKYLQKKSKNAGYLNAKVGRKVVIGTNYYSGENNASSYTHLLLRGDIKKYLDKFSVICSRKKGIRVRQGKVIQSGYYYELKK